MQYEMKNSRKYSLRDRTRQYSAKVGLGASESAFPTSPASVTRSLPPSSLSLSRAAVGKVGELRVEESFVCATISLRTICTRQYHSITLESLTLLRNGFPIGVVIDVAMYEFLDFFKILVVIFTMVLNVEYFHSFCLCVSLSDVTVSNFLETLQGKQVSG
jgi:hypothetical protein